MVLINILLEIYFGSAINNGTQVHVSLSLSGTTLVVYSLFFD